MREVRGQREEAIEESDEGREREKKKSGMQRGNTERSDRRKREKHGLKVCMEK